jgi:hypothetical protein
MLASPSSVFRFYWFVHAIFESPFDEVLVPEIGIRCMLASVAGFLYWFVQFSTFDVLVIGGGPRQCHSGVPGAPGPASVVARKEHFPRFHIGESLLPYNRQLFEELGVLPPSKRLDSSRRSALQFHLGNGSQFVQFVFRQGRFTREPGAFRWNAPRSISSCWNTRPAAPKCAKAGQCNAIRVRR